MKWKKKVYKGYWKNAKKHGYGEMLWVDGGYEKGTWINDSLNGFVEQYFGKTSEFAGDSFKGQMINDQYHGEGKYYHKKADVTYSGSFLKGKKCGLGTQTHGKKSDFPGRVYRGEFKNSMRHGYGIDTFGDTGKWANDKYEGNWINDEKHGKGTYYWNDGGVFEGTWRNDNQHGKGKYVYPNGRVFEGVWDMGYCKELAIELYGYE
jgi:hypothetical protein